VKGMLLRVLAILFVQISLLLAAPAAFANGLPTAAHVTTAGGLLVPVPGIPVVLDEADIVIDASRAGATGDGGTQSSATQADAAVTVTYVLRNLAPAPVKLSMAFPVPPSELPVEADGGGVQVSWNGAALAYRRVEAPKQVVETDLAIDKRWLDPFTGVPYEPRLFGQEAEPVFVSFDLAFKEGETGTLTVRYRQMPGRDYSRFVEPALRYDYLLMPARHWPEVRRIGVTVRIPPAFSAASNLKLEDVAGGAPGGGGAYTAYKLQFTALPGENLSVFVSPGRSLVPAFSSVYWRQGGRLWLLTLATIAAACLGGVLLVLMRGSRMKITLAGVALFAASALGLYTGFLRSPLFGPNPISLAATLILVPAVLSVVYLLVLRFVYGRLRHARASE